MEGLSGAALVEFITGADQNLSFVRTIGEGACGQVHVV
jgi:hypothetical protein